MYQFNHVKTKFEKKNIYIFGFCFFLSLLFLLIATKSSPLYPFNDWVDANISFTMGKGMMNGKVLYRDLFDHKGPLFYFLYGLAYLISNVTFFGVFIFEVISFSVFMFFAFKTITLFINSKYALIALTFLAGLILNLNSFVQGGSSEEFCLPLVAISLYYSTRYFKNVYPKEISKRWLLINGIIAGCVLWIKFSFLGFWLGWMVSIFIFLLFKKGFLRATISSLIFLSGMFITTIPWIIYFGVNHSINEWINSYFIINLTSYSKDTSIGSIFSSTILGILSHLVENPVTLGFLIFGLLVFLIYQKFITNGFHKLNLIFCFLFLAFSVFGGGRNYVYYFLIFSPFIIFAFIVICMLFYEKFGRISALNTLYIIFFFLITTYIYTFVFNQNIYMMNMDKGDIVQYKYAAIINQTEDATLLNYGVLDLGFYTTTGIVPNVRFFHKPNIEYSKFPIIEDEQNRYIKEQVVDYVVTVVPVSYSGQMLEMPYLKENYILIEDEIQESEENKYYYLLFKKKPNSFVELRL